MDLDCALPECAFAWAAPKKDAFGEAWPVGSDQEKMKGALICEGRRFVCWGLTADLEYLANDIGLPHFNSLEPCWFDAASRREDTIYPITDMRQNSAWKATLISFEEGIDSPFTDHPIQHLVGFTRFHICGDLMHTGCLGVVQTMIGSVLWELTFDGPFVGSQDRRVEQIWALIQKHYALLNTPTRLGNLSIAHFTSKDAWNSLRAKAAQSQHLLFCLPYVLREVHDGSPHHEHRLRAVIALVRIYKAFKDNPIVLPGDVADGAMENLQSLYDHWRWLTRRSMERGELNWAIKQKLHTLYHIVDHAKYLNPRCTWCYEYEDHMNSVVLAAKACMAGSPMHIVGSKVIQNALLVIALSLPK